MARFRLLTSRELQAQMNCLWTVQEICARFNVTAMTVGQWCKRDKPLPHISIRGYGYTRPTLRFVPTEADKWIKNYRTSK